MYQCTSAYAGTQPFNDWFAPDTVQRHQLGLKVDAVDPFWGWGEFIYGKASGSIAKGLVCVLDESYNAVGVPNATIQAFPLCVAMSKMATLTFGWFMKSGLAVYATTATVAADAPMAISGVGTLGATAISKGINGLRNRKAATATVTVTALTTNQTGILKTSGYDGFFTGMALSGTGIPASTVVAKLDPDGQTIYTGSAIGTLGDKNSTATGTITLTGTYTGFGAGIIDSPFAQGAIT